MKVILAGITLLIFSEKLIKHFLVMRFFRQPIPAELPDVRLVSILQPILSGDPSMPAGLEQNLAMQTRYPVEFLWLVDVDDTEAQAICRVLIDHHPHKLIKLILLPAPAVDQNPKMVKLIAGAVHAQGNVLCVLDDDTRLPDAGLEMCLPYLGLPEVGLSFGLPYYVSFNNFWSQLVAYFVNSQSLMNYVPFAMLTNPVTINGMFYAIRRSVFDKIGGFNGLENTLADDFAVAQRLRRHGYRLAQTSLRHAISTWVANPRDYFNLIQRWFIFPRESILQYLKGREKIFFYITTLLPVLLPWLALSILLIDPQYWPVTLIYFAYSYLIFAHFNLAYLHKSSPWAGSYWVILISLFLPLQILAALIAPQRIIWRGHVMEAKPGGGFQFIRRRK